MAALSGPNHAEEVARGTPAAAVLAADHHDLAAELSEFIGNASFRVYSSDDVAGVELGGALKTSTPSPPASPTGWDWGTTRSRPWSRVRSRK